jgi:hypothetical protein
MPTSLIALLSGPKTWAVMGACLVLALAGLQTVRLAHAKADLAGARAALVDPVTRKTWVAEARAASTNLSQATAALAAQSTAIAGLRADSDRRLSAAGAALRVAEQAARGAGDRAAAALAARSGPDGCKSADALILGSLAQ